MEEIEDLLNIECQRHNLTALKLIASKILCCEVDGDVRDF